MGSVSLQYVVERGVVLWVGGPGGSVVGDELGGGVLQVGVVHGAAGGGQHHVGVAGELRDLAAARWWFLAVPGAGLICRVLHLQRLQASRLLLSISAVHVVIATASRGKVLELLLLLGLIFPLQLTHVLLTDQLLQSLEPVSLRGHHEGRSTSGPRRAGVPQDLARSVRHIQHAEHLVIVRSADDVRRSLGHHPAVSLTSHSGVLVPEPGSGSGHGGVDGPLVVHERVAVVAHLVHDLRRTRLPLRESPHSLQLIAGRLIGLGKLAVAHARWPRRHQSILVEALCSHCASAG
ncbi:unnamed protein product [Chrysodeixis includens]|uniref:Uncharacterized protein n=1 Tax=Chrysodeixis includens TaxID=689277 RepID=A0A9N8L0L4_CHRIL|nr:unnamed protein product [Chrysodeixis includens]